MTLGEIATLVTTKIHRNDSTATAEAKVYAKSRYSMIWDSRLWRDTQRLFSFNIGNTKTAILPHNIDRVVACRWGESTLLNYEQPVTVLVINPTLFDQSGDPATYSLIAPSGVSVAPSGNKIQMAANNAAASYTVTIHGALAGVELHERLTINGTTWIDSAHSYDEIFSLSKNSTTYGLTVLDAGGIVTLLTLDPEETHRVHQRLHFYSTPETASTTVLILAKVRCKPLIYDSDATQISGIDHGLVAMTEADLLESGRQYQKAALKMQEAGMLISNAATMETEQSANMCRLIPADCY